MATTTLTMTEPQGQNGPVELRSFEITTQAQLENGDARSLSSTHGADSAGSRNVTGTKQRWNHPQRNMWKVFAAFICFSVVGANDGAYGVNSLPHPIRLPASQTELTMCNSR